MLFLACFKVGRYLVPKITLFYMLKYKYFINHGLTTTPTKLGYWWDHDCWRVSWYVGRWSLFPTYALSSSVLAGVGILSWVDGSRSVAVQCATGTVFPPTFSRHQRTVNFPDHKKSQEESLLPQIKRAAVLCSVVIHIRIAVSPTSPDCQEIEKNTTKRNCKEIKLHRRIIWDYLATTRTGFQPLARTKEQGQRWTTSTTCFSQTARRTAFPTSSWPQTLIG